MEKYPIKLSPVLKEAIWGGNRLKEEYSKKSDTQNIAESWELSTEKECVIENGPLEGTAFRDYLEKNNIEVNLLIKLIDANDRLSVQVHPDDAFAKANENSLGKTEMWHVIDAKPNAKLIYGIKEGIDENKIGADLCSGNFAEVLNSVDVHAGDTFFIPAGTVHAIGEGILIAEVQQNSNVTYRLYDYDRTDKNGNKRELHTEKGLKVIKNLSNAEIDKKAFSNGKEENALCNCEYFKVLKYDINGQKALDFKNYCHVLCVNGKGKINGYEIKKGDSFFIPPLFGEFLLKADENLSVIVSSEN